MSFQPSLSIAFQGEAGAYSEEAARNYFGERIQILPRSSFAAVFAAVETGQADRGLIPIENSLAGSIHRNYDLMLRHGLHIVGETHLRVRHCLLALPGTVMKDLREVRSHPQALAQCEAFLTELTGVEAVAAFDTAGSARQVKEGGDSQVAAIASARAAHVHELEILAAEIEDDATNYTRFVALGREPVSPSSDAKTSVVFTLENQPGALHGALAVFARQDIDLTKIESRPLIGKPWEYHFFLDFAGSTEEPHVMDALEELEAMAPMLRLLGSYPRERW